MECANGAQTVGADYYYHYYDFRGTCTTTTFAFCACGGEDPKAYLDYYNYYDLVHHSLIGAGALLLFPEKLLRNTISYD